MIVYKMTSGFAHDLRFEHHDYALQPGEIEFLGGASALPALDSLHDPAAVQAREDELATERARKQSIRVDALAAELRAQLSAATPQQISNYVDAQVTDLASARTMFKRLLLVLALIANGG